MCGFAGLLTSTEMTRDALMAHAARMTAPIAHRGPDDDGLWVDPRAGVALGFRRLAILDLSPQGHQPMHSPSGRFVTLFNGEVYNFKDLRHRLEQHGFRFRGGSDTEIILAAFEQWGIREAVTRFVGMFAIAVWDTATRELSLIRDRLGKKPLFVYSEPGLVTFGSELKTLMAGPSFDSTIDRDALASYLRYLYVPAPQCIFGRAIKVPAGHMLTIGDPRLSLPPSEPYWSLETVARDGLANPINASEAETIDHLDALLGDAVRCRMHSDVPLGALLSGGIDSSTVVALMQEASARPVKTYTIGFSEQAFDEAEHAARVASHLGTDHTALCLTGDDARSLVPRLPEIFDEPLADPSQLPTLLVSQLARRQVTVALSGDGGDELFGGYNRYVYGVNVLRRVNRIPMPLRRCVAAGIGSVPAAAWNRVDRAATVLMGGVSGGRVGERIQKVGNLMGASSEEGMYRSLLSAWQQPDRLVSGCSKTRDRNGEILHSGQPAHLLDRMMLADQTTYLADDLLAKLDRASMAISLEVRAPLLDHRVVEFSWRLPRALKLRGDVGKWILRQVLYRRVPRDIVERPKMGFSVPIDRWLRGPLRDWAGALLSTQALADSGLTPAPIASAWNDLQTGRRQSGSALWAVVMFQAWRERWNARCASLI
jgi:asparagine synthase (glutamine-hydrolysing)